MKKIQFICAFITLLLASQSLFAFSIGKEDDPYYENNIKWQQVKYNDSDCGFISSLPGIAKSGISDEDVYSYTSS